MPFTIAKIRKFAKFVNASDARWQKFKEIMIEVAKEHDDTTFRPLRCFQDVRVRWDSTNRMLMRAQKLRESIDRYATINCPKLSLNDLEWQQIDYVVTILRPFAVFTQLIGSTREPTIHRVFGVYSILLNHIEAVGKKLVRKKLHWKVAIWDGLVHAKDKLLDYYEKTQPANLYGIAVFIDPAAKDSFWKSQYWQELPMWESTYWVELEYMVKAEYGDRTLERRRKLIPKTLKRKDVSLDDIVSNIFAEVHDDQEEEDLQGVEAELLEYRAYGTYYYVGRRVGR